LPIDWGIYEQWFKDLESFWVSQAAEWLHIWLTRTPFSIRLSEQTEIQS
jgi:hypothetical protein